MEILVFDIVRSVEVLAGQRVARIDLLQGRRADEYKARVYSLEEGSSEQRAALTWAIDMVMDGIVARSAEEAMDVALARLLSHLEAVQR